MKSSVILFYRLVLKVLATLQIKPDQAILFYKNSVEEFLQLGDELVYNVLKPNGGPIGRIWALVDTN